MLSSSLNYYAPKIHDSNNFLVSYKKILKAAILHTHQIRPVIYHNLMNALNDSGLLYGST